MTQINPIAHGDRKPSPTAQRNMLLWDLGLRVSDNEDGTFAAMMDGYSGPGFGSNPPFFVCESIENAWDACWSMYWHSNWGQNIVSHKGYTCDIVQRHRDGSLTLYRNVDNELIIAHETELDTDHT